ncbi:MAG: hypothetical protein A3C79_03300 [Candidatus Taylorbacteria bacterium RIFCSPHIGHO2_02_FULL_45_28]|nr:MAG: hypothetical protein A3C79_03300 [Candidatus Taylorbacteria bacterium RIFCSPHIGHO2_02_FULL_45_28]
MFIRTPDDRRILVDGGGNAEIIRHITNILPFYSRGIDVVVATNTDGKNVSGLIDVIERYEVERAYIPRFTLENTGTTSSTDDIYRTFLGELGDLHIQTHEVAAGDQIPLSGSDDGSSVQRVTAQVLFPVPADMFEYSKASAPELLFSLSYGKTSILFMGDASKKVQKLLASSSAVISGSIGDTDVLIISHSALPANMSSGFINIARPRALIFKKTVTKSSTDTSKSAKSKSTSITSSISKDGKKITPKKKIVADPLVAILDEDRFNLKEAGTVKIVSDGEGVIISGNIE